MTNSRFQNISLGFVIKVVSTLVLVILVLIYAQFQARNFIQGPTISISTPYTPIQQEQKISLEGSVDNIVKLTLNGRDIHTDENGLFSEHILLEKGLTVITISAEDRFGRSASVEREYVYVEKE